MLEFCVGRYMFRQYSDRPKYFWAYSVRIVILGRDVMQILPAVQPTTTLDAPILWLDLGVSNDGFICRSPIHAVRDTLDLQIGIREHDISVRPALSEAFTERHPTIRQPAFVSVDVDQTADHTDLGERIKDGDHSVDRSERIPDAVVRVIVRLRAVPEWILSGVVLWRKTGADLIVIALRSVKLRPRASRQNLRLAACTVIHEDPSVLDRGSVEVSAEVELSSSTLTEPLILPLSCIWLNPVMFDPSLANPPWSSPLTSATALAIPKGSVAPGKTCPPSTVPMSGFTKFRMSAPLWHSASSVSAKTVRTFVILVMVELAGTKKRCS
ncbi:hypothetical protein KC347_g218 [Hortaea werneckii]|nr:hypothetical protein KC347_g218 [Hortaea werneckii]